MSSTGTVPARAANNGHAVTDATFPVDSFKDAAIHLRRPFTPAAVKFKVQATWPSGGLIVAYIDARLVVERLNLIVPHLWQDAYRPLGSGQMWCDLTVDAITRSDVGEGVGKGLVSDALKRAAVRFGIGVSLYATPALSLNNQHLKRKESRGKETVTITDDGMRVVRSAYAAWLDEHGRQAFGEPLDHGDVDGAQGDHEAEPVPVEDAVPQPVPLSAEKRQKVLNAVALTDVTEDEWRLYRTSLGAASDEALTADHARTIRAWLDKRAASDVPSDLPKGSVDLADGDVPWENPDAPGGQFDQAEARASA